MASGFASAVPVDSRELTVDREDPAGRASTVCQVSCAGLIVVENLKKYFRVHKRPPGVAAALRSVLHRTYDTVKAVDDISFRIERGERVGFLGPNGAGKTATCGSTITRRRSARPTSCDASRW
jgi:ABC-type glutathione transport system ATPase component